MKKKIAALLLALTMTLGAAVPVFASGEDRVTLNMSIMFNQNVRLTYQNLGGVNQPQAEWHALDGNIYREGDMKPVWAELENRVNFTINDITPTAPANLGAKFTLWQAENFVGVDILNAPGGMIVQEGVINQTFLNFNDFLDRMPNFSRFLDENEMVRRIITSGDGAIYYIPYFDGFEDISHMKMARFDWIDQILDAPDPEFSTDRVVTPFYQIYMPESLDIELVVPTHCGTQLQTIRKAYDRNIILIQNELEVMDGYSLAMALRDYIDSTYGDQFERRSHLFTGPDAVFDADELVALMRAVYANSTMLTGQDEFPVAAFYPRNHNPQRVRDLFRFAQIWGVRGLESRNGRLFLDQEGVLHDGYMTEEAIASLDRLHQLYNEGLILQDFDRNEATAGLPGGEHRTRLNQANLGFMTYDFNQTTTAYNRLEEEIPGFILTPMMPAIADWNNDGTYWHFVESWRSIHGDAWTILAHVAEDEAKLETALALFDYLWTDSGRFLMNFGPYEWRDGEIVYFGRTLPAFHPGALEELHTLAGGNFTNYLRMWLGAQMPVGFMKDQGMEYQLVHPNGQIGLSNILAGVTLGTVRHLTHDLEGAQDPSFFVIPTRFATTMAEEEFLRDFVHEWENIHFNYPNNDSTRHLFTDYVLYGFGGVTTAGVQLLDQQGLLDFVRYDLNGLARLEVLTGAFSRMMQ